MRLHPRKIIRNIRLWKNEIRRQKTFVVVTITNLLVVFVAGYTLYISYNTLPFNVPLLYVLPWGTTQLVAKGFLSFIVAGMFLVLILNTFLAVKNIKDAAIPIVKFYALSGLIINTVFSIFLFRIIKIVTLEAIQIPNWARYIGLPILMAFTVTIIIIPIVIKFAKRYGYVDDPLRHKHPAMLLTKTVPRAGGLAFYLGVLIPSIFILPITQSQKLVGIFLGALICVITGLRDDKKDVSPFVRLGIQIIAVFITVMSGIILVYFPNPIGNALKLDDYKFVVDLFNETRVIHYVSVFAASIWMLIMMNFMSWANGTDGVYAGLVSIGGLVMSILIYTTALAIEPNIHPYIQLSALIAGAGFAMAIFTWPPQKLLWGFGATAPALMIAAISIIGSTKVATTVLVLIVPFLDGTWAIIRRLSRKQSPFFGDREHFHHLLLDDLGWPKSRIATMYWGVTIMLAVIGLTTDGVTSAIAFGITATVAITLIAALNFKGRKRVKKSKNQQQIATDKI